ncbi:MAG: hypothetical protein IJP43_09640 [Oscillospiraceae bacterium]|nr:hypothetical protein [Oscillospiraceae bacterium]
MAAKPPFPLQFSLFAACKEREEARERKKPKGDFDFPLWKPLKTTQKGLAPFGKPLLVLPAQSVVRYVEAGSKTKYAVSG